MFQINRVAVGLDDLIGGKSWPTRPGAMADQLVLTYDARAEFLAARQRAILGSISATSTGLIPGAAPLIVPDGEAWFVSDVSQRTSGQIGAGDTLEWLPVIRPLGSGNFLSPSIVPQIGTVGLWPAMAWSVNAWWQPGTNFGLFVKQKIGVTNYTVEVSIRYTPVLL